MFPGNKPFAHCHHHLLNAKIPYKAREYYVLVERVTEGGGMYLCAPRATILPRAVGVGKPTHSCSRSASWRRFCMTASTSGATGGAASAAAGSTGSLPWCAGAAALAAAPASMPSTSRKYDIVACTPQIAPQTCRCSTQPLWLQMLQAANDGRGLAWSNRWQRSGTHPGQHLDMRIVGSVPQYVIQQVLWDPWQSRRPCVKRYISANACGRSQGSMEQ